MEAPLYQDGPLPSVTTEHSSASHTSTAWHGLLAQYAYPLDPIPIAATGGKRRANNGVSEILALDDRTLLLVSARIRDRRAGLQIPPFASTKPPSPRRRTCSARDHWRVRRFVPMSKRLMLDLNTAAIGEIDNIESGGVGSAARRRQQILLLISG